MAKDMKIDFNPKLFNNVYWHLLDAFNNALVRFIWVYGGSSASKTYSVVQLQIITMLSGEDENALILRKYATDIKDSIYSDFKNIISLWGLGEYFIIQQNYIYCKVTGSYVRFRGLDDSEKVKGISNFKRVIMEEVSQFDELDFKQIKKRLRGKKGQQIIGIFNPVTEEHWIKTNVFDLDVFDEIPCDITLKQVNKQGNTLILKTNYTDNKFIVGEWEGGKLIGGFVDTHVIEDFEKDKLTDYNYYQIYGLGNWGKIRTGGEFWKDFNSNTHTTKDGWDEDFPIHITWDENVNPFLTCLVWQIKGKTAIQIDEICLQDPRNRRHHVCNEFRARYPQGRVKGLFVYGDKTSLKEDTAKEKGENFFTDILTYLSDYKPTLRLQTVNPSIVQSAGFINSVYAGRIQGLNILINEKCKKSLNDYQYALEDSDGTLKKNKVKHPVTGVSYEEFGHPSDAKRYFMTVAFASEYQTYLRGGRNINIKTGKTLPSKHSY
jgi:hypothetical protein